MIIFPKRLPRNSQFGAKDTWYFKSAALDLSGIATDSIAFYANEAMVLAGYSILYEEGSSSSLLDFT